MFERLFGKPKPKVQSRSVHAVGGPATSATGGAGRMDFMRDTLFGDKPLAEWPADSKSSDAFPWSVFDAARVQATAGDVAGATALWQQILAAPDLESRHYLQAWHFLRERGVQPPPEIAKSVLGIVVEVGMPRGVDLLAAYSDHSARYWNHAGGGVAWEHPDTSLDANIDALVAAAADVVAKVGPWEKPRPPAPPAGQMRLNFLTPSGLHFGQAPMEKLAADPLGGPVVHLATRLLQALTAKDTGRG